MGVSGRERARPRHCGMSMHMRAFATARARSVAFARRMLRRSRGPSVSAIAQYRSGRALNQFGKAEERLKEHV